MIWQPVLLNCSRNLIWIKNIADEENQNVQWFLKILNKEDINTSNGVTNLFVKILLRTSSRADSLISPD